MSKTLDLNTLAKAISSRSAGVRCRTILQPAGGKGDKVFPPTYADAVYAHEYRQVEVEQDGKMVSVPKRCVLLNSVQSEANLAAEAIQDAIDDGQLKLPVVETDFSDQPIVELGSDSPGLFEPVGRITHYETPHRIVDAILRDSELDGTAFRVSEIGKQLNHSTIRNATSLFNLCPHALVYGVWDSTGPKGGRGFKFQRAIVSETIGVDVQIGAKTSSRIDPLSIGKDCALLYEDGTGGWTLKKTKKKLGKDGKPSRANHGNIRPDISKMVSDPLDPTGEGRIYLAGGVTMDHAVQTVVLSFPALRRLRFPLTPTERADPKVNDAARTALAALAICGSVLASERGLDLRSRCLLQPVEPLRWELLGAPGEQPVEYEINSDEAIALVNDAFAAAKKAGLDWREEPLTLKPTEQLVTLVRNSQQKAIEEKGGDN